MSAEYLQSLFGLDEQVAVVTGGTGTLGGALCRGLAKAGASVIVAGRGADRGEACVKEIVDAGGKAAFLPVDVTSRSSIEALLAATLDRFSRVDMLINGAGVNSASSYFDVEDEDWQRVLDTNLLSVHLGCQVFGQHMAAAGGGAIVNIASVTAHIPPHVCSPTQHRKPLL